MEGRAAGWMVLDGMDGEIERMPGHEGPNPLLVLLKAGLAAGQAERAGTGERSHTLGSQSAHRSLKGREESTRESVCFHMGLESHLRLLKSSAGPSEILFANILLGLLEQQRLGRFYAV